MFKLGMALVFAVIAALVVFLTGLLGDARMMTALLRSLIAFFCAGAFTYFVAFILEAKGWAAFDKMPAERMQDMQMQDYGAEDIDFDAVEKKPGAEEKFAAPPHFRPMSEESLTHMKTPPTNGDEGTPVPA